MKRCVSVVITFRRVPHKILCVTEVERGELLLTFSQQIHDHIFTFRKSTQIGKLTGYLVQNYTAQYWCLLQQWRHSTQLCPRMSIFLVSPREKERLCLSCWGVYCWNSSKEEQERKWWHRRRKGKAGREKLGGQAQTRCSGTV